jgi:hypothetical protein
MDTHEAFETLLHQLRQALEDAQATGTRAFQEGRFEDARAAAQRGEDINVRIKELETLQGRWSLLVQGAEQSPKADRLPRGEKTPQEDFWLPILIALEEMGGRGQVQQVLDRVERMVKDRLREVDWLLLTDGRSIRWRNTAQWARHQMLRDGLLALNSPRGMWEITEAGRAYLRKHRSDISVNRG